MIQRLQAKRNEEGFTLIELLIVIIVLGILAAIVVFAIGTTRSDAVESSCRTNFKAVELSSEAVQTKTGAVGADQASITAPAPGALLKSWPTSSDYTISYAAGVITVGGSKVVGGTTAAGCVKA
jgi:prepilin-type N-terminal cleavage/methylation domain-containing protein